MEKPHKKLKAWQEAMDLCIKIYEITEKFSKGELFGLVAQMRRSAVSIPSNIAEGAVYGLMLNLIERNSLFHFTPLLVINCK